MKNKQLSDNCLSDFINNNAYHRIYSKEEERYLLKTLKLAFYDDVSDELKEEYLNYYMEVHPVFASKYQEASEKDKPKLLAKAIERAIIVKEEFIKHNLRLVISLAKSYQHTYYYLELMDLIQVGSLGLTVAIEKFEISKNLKFSTYAAYWIKAYFSRMAISERPVRFPQNKVFLYNKVAIKARSYYNQTLENPTDEMLIEWGIPPKNIDEYNLYKASFSSLNEPAIIEGNEIGDLIESEAQPVDEMIENKLMTLEILNLLENSNITKEEKEIIKRQYGFYEEIESLKTIADSLGQTPEQVRIKRNKALKILKNEMRKMDFFGDRHLIKKKVFKK